ncbi:MAG: carboxypeptidase-like regulatory domain-containing protein [Bacteroidales bacterium]|nr:carboxypeptidase-like regulatory domain-containing protein [Bacteroidales bacterium]
MADEKKGTEEKGKETGNESSEMIQIIASILKSTPIEIKKELGRIVRTDADIWNAVNGVGSVEKSLEKGSYEGIVKSGNTLLANVSVTAQQEGVDKASVVTDANGCYKIELEGGSYDLIYSLKDYHTETKDNEPIFPEVEMTKNVELTSVV